VVADEQGRRSLVWSVYDIGGREFVTPLLSQLWYGVRSLAGAPYSVLFASERRAPHLAMGHARSCGVLQRVWASPCCSQPDAGKCLLRAQGDMSKILIMTKRKRQNPAWLHLFLLSVLPLSVLAQAPP